MAFTENQVSQRKTFLSFTETLTLRSVRNVKYFTLETTEPELQTKHMITIQEEDVTTLYAMVNYTIL